MPPRPVPPGPAREPRPDAPGWGRRCGGRQSGPGLPSPVSAPTRAPSRASGRRLVRWRRRNPRLLPDSAALGGGVNSRVKGPGLSAGPATLRLSTSRGGFAQDVPCQPPPGSLVFISLCAYPDLAWPHPSPGPQREAPHWERTPQASASPAVMQGVEVKTARVRRVGPHHT